MSLNGAHTLTVEEGRLKDADADDDVQRNRAGTQQRLQAVQMVGGASFRIVRIELVDSCEVLGQREVAEERALFEVPRQQAAGRCESEGEAKR